MSKPYWATLPNGVSRSLSRPLLFLACLACSIAGCSSDPTATDGGPPVADGAGPVADGAGPPAKQLEPFAQPFVIINDPPGIAHLTTHQSTVALGGVAGGVKQLIVEHQVGQAAPKVTNVALAHRWRIADLALQAGDNTIAVRGRGDDDAAYSDTIVITCNPELPLEPVEAAPRELEVGDTDPVLVTVKIDAEPARIGAEGVRLHAVDDEGQVAGEPLATLGDTGTDGDETAGDGIYSARMTVDTAGVGPRRYRLTIAATPAAGAAYTAHSEVFAVEVLPAFSAQDAEDLVDALALAATKYESLRKNAPTTKEAMTKLAAGLEQLETVDEAVVDDDGERLWWTMKSGVMAGHSDVPDDILAGGAQAKLAGIVLGPYATELGPEGEQVKSIGELLKEFRCPAIDPTEPLADGAVTLEAMKRLTDYDVIYFSGHGGLVTRRVSRGKARGTICVSLPTSVDYRALGSKDHPLRKDLLAGRLIAHTNAKGDKMFLVTSLFVEHYNRRFKPGTVVHLRSCRSAKNMTMAQAFLKGGAAAYTGYTEKVSVGYSKEVGETFFDHLKRGKTVIHALLEARNEHGHFDPHIKQRRGYDSRLVSVTADEDLRIGIACDGFTRLEMSWVSNLGTKKHAIYHSVDKLEPKPYSGGATNYIKEALKTYTAFHEDVAAKTTTASGSRHDLYAGFSELDFERRSTVTKLEIDRDAQTIKLDPLPSSAHFDDGEWVEWRTDEKSWKGSASFSGRARSWLSTTRWGESDVEIGEDYVKGTITFDFSAKPDYEQAKGTLEFYYDVIPKE